MADVDNTAPEGPLSMVVSGGVVSQVGLLEQSGSLQSIKPLPSLSEESLHAVSVHDNVQLLQLPNPSQYLAHEPLAPTGQKLVPQKVTEEASV